MSHEQIGGLPCRACGSTQTTVIDSRASTFRQGGRANGRSKDPRIRRRRKCLQCGARFTTEERYRDDDAEAARQSLADRLKTIASEIEDTPY